MKEIKTEILEVIVKVGGVEKLLNSDVRPFFNKYGVTNTQNAIGYFQFTKQGQARVKKALAN